MFTRCPGGSEQRRRQGTRTDTDITVRETLSEIIVKLSVIGIELKVSIQLTRGFWSPRNPQSPHRGPQPLSDGPQVDLELTLTLKGILHLDDLLATECFDLLNVGPTDHLT